MIRAGCWFFSAIVLLHASCSERPATQPKGTTSSQIEQATLSGDAAMRRAVEWLVKQQSLDGSWRSATYGQMRGGAGNTALAVYALSCAPEPLRREHHNAVLRGLRSLVESLDKRHGFVVGREGPSDYPTYATALVLLAMEQLEVTDWKKERQRMTDYLAATQQREQDGMSFTDLDYGGWNHTGGDETGGRFAGETNVSVTSFALEALARENALDDSARTAALTFLARCQNFAPEHRTGDGGFFFTPIANDPRNKAGADDPPDQPSRARSYGSATADGLVAMLACGLPEEDPRVQAALGWFARHNQLGVAPGFGADALAVSSRKALEFYYQLALARLMHRLPKSWLAEHRAELSSRLIREQRPDGSWQNQNPLMREDDPLIATGLALAALALCETH